MKDTLVLAALVLGFATLVTLHVTLAVRLVRQKPRWRGPVALLVPPLALLWAFRAGWYKSGTLWLVALLVYVVALITAQA